jgi:hypothetical protein
MAYLVVVKKSNREHMTRMSNSVTDNLTMIHQLGSSLLPEIGLCPALCCKQWVVPNESFFAESKPTIVTF